MTDKPRFAGLIRAYQAYGFDIKEAKRMVASWIRLHVKRAFWEERFEELYRK